MSEKWNVIEPGVWKPENEGDCIEGVYVNKKEGVGIKEGGIAYYVETENEGIKMIWGTTVLDDRMALVEVGSYVRITYKETIKNKKDQPLKIYQVEVKGGVDEIGL